MGRLQPEFDKRGVKVVAISSDERDRAQVMADKLRAPALRMAYDLSLSKAREWGLYISTARGTTSIGIEEPPTPASFLAEVGQTGVDTFSELDPFVPFIGPPLLGPLARNAGPFGYSVTTTTGEFRAGFRSGAISGGENQIWLESYRTQDTLIFSDFSSGVAGLGGNFFNTTFGGGVGAGVFGAICITASDADGTASVLLRSTSLSTFLGVVMARRRRG